MIDCGATDSCLIPMWMQYVILVVAFALFVLKVLLPKDPYDRM